jgi:hypothetical protein
MTVGAIARTQRGAALVLVLLGILVFVAAGAFIMLAVDRNSDLRLAFQRNVVGFNSAEAGIHVGAVGVQNAMLNFALPTNCTTAGTSFNINGRTVTYRLSVPTGAPWNGTAGSCTETPVTITEAPGTAYAGLNAQLYTYNLAASAKNTLGFTESTINNQFQSHLIPMFQFMGFYAGDLELLPGPTAVINGRLHSNRDMYLSDGTCGAAPGSGLNVLGQITIVGSGVSGTAPLNRGRKDDTTQNANNVYISKDGQTSNMQVLGTDAAGSTSCANTAMRQIPASEINTLFNGLGPRIVTGLQNISLPTLSGLMCVPWITGCGANGGQYWQGANVRIALDTTATTTLANGSVLYKIEVLNLDGSVNATQTTQLVTMMNARPGAITYSDVPKATSSWDCRVTASCETVTYAVGDTTAYAQPFPVAGDASCGAGFPGRGPRVGITSANYCGDYRYGGFYNWRERKPVLMLNIDWIALEEYNNVNGNVFFNPTTTTNGGLIVFLTVKDTTGTQGLKATNYGVRVYDAGRARRNLTDPGVTFATDQAMYVTGNFNCPSPTWTGAVTSPAPCGDASWPPTGSSTYQKPTAVVADTLNVLSCNWVTNPAQACGPVAMGADVWVQGTYRPIDEMSTTQSGTITATGTSVSCGGSGCQSRETIINAAFLAGTDPTWCPTNSNGTNCGNTYYSGGVENYPRFHEDWSGTDALTNRPRNLWYEGALVSSGAPSHTCFEFNAQLVAIANDPSFSCSQAGSTQGFWSTQRYSPPPRRWFYDVSFNNGSYLPPLTPRFVYLTMVFFTQVYQ